MLTLLISFKCLIYILLVLVSVAFITLFERKALSGIGLRAGPTTVGLLGLLQPISDAMKLFSSKVFLPLHSSTFFFLLPSWLALSVVFCVWLLSPSLFGGSDFSLSSVYMMICLGAGVYILLWAGMFSGSSYSSLGGTRGLAQSTSYEVMFFLIMLSLMSTVYSYNLFVFSDYKNLFLFIYFLSSGSWVISMLAETGRTPFDFSEGESELVSGFNTEYSSGPFALFFLGEYGSILFMSVIFSYIFIGSIMVNLLASVWVIFFFIWVRGTLPRLRFDKLMMLAWLILLPVVLTSLALSSVTFFT